MRPLKRAWPLLVAAAFIMVFGSCTASQPPFSQAGLEPVPGFWKGFWHGFIAPVSFVVSLFAADLRIYAFPNTGRWYDLGFMLGISGFSGGVLAGSRNQQKERRP